MRIIIRLDDASEKMNLEKWEKIEKILDDNGVKPLVGIIPECKDSDMSCYNSIDYFWDEIIPRWSKKEWTFALHGLNHLNITSQGGINPINKKSEFAGLPLETQKEKITKGLSILNFHKINPKVFFAPFHTFDKNTLLAIKECSEIKIISDTIANKPYSKYGFTFVPQQSGNVRNMKLKVVTFCYHPNIMSDSDFVRLDTFLKRNKEKIMQFPLSEVKNKRSFFDCLISFLYFARKRLKRFLKKSNV